MTRRRSGAAGLGFVVLVAIGLGLPIAALADPPIAVDDSATVSEDAAPTVVDVLANDGDADLDPLTIVGATDPAHGTVTVATDRLTVSYEPDPNYFGGDSFDYTVDAGGETDVGTVSVTVDPVNDPPVADNDPAIACGFAGFGNSYPIPEDWGTFTWVEGAECWIGDNDVDPDGDDLTFELVGPASHGDVDVNSDGTADYTPDPNYNTVAGAWLSDSFTYRVNDGAVDSAPATVRLWIAPINDDPSFTSGGNVTVAEGSAAYNSPWATAIAAGPPDEAGQDVTFEVTDVDVPALFSSGPVVTAGGRLQFTPAANAFGLAHVSVVAHDDGGLEDYGADLSVPPDDTSDPVTFTITVSGVNDPPSFVKGADQALSEDAGPSTVVGWASSISPGPVNEDSQTLTFVVTDNTNAALFSAGPAVSAAGTLSFTPAANAHGNATISLQLTDNGGTAGGGDDSSPIVSFGIAVSSINDDPVADDDSVLRTEDDPPLNINVLAGDTDADGSDTLTIVAITDPPGLGTAEIVSNGTRVRYTVTPNANGVDTFEYQVGDGHGGFTTATVTVTISAVNDDPLPGPDSADIPEEAGATAIDALANDGDVDDPHGVLMIVATTNGTKGAVAITVSGTGLTYDPFTNASGPDSFTYTVSDGHGGSAVGTVSITIAGDNDVPIAGNDGLAPPITIPEGAGPTSLPVLANDSDLDGDTLTITQKTNGSHGTVLVTGGGSGLTYDPDTGFAGSDQFTYTVSDGRGGTDSATVIVTVAIDVVAPTVTAPRLAIVGAVGGATVRVTVVWAGFDGGSGLASFQLQQRIDGGPFTTVALPDPLATKLSRSLPVGHTYAFRVRATDVRGNRSGWKGASAS